MKYILLIYHNEHQWNELSESERQEMYAEYRTLREQLISRKQWVDGSQLQHTDTANSVQIRDDKEIVIDGPFAETHEQLGGFFLIDVNDINEAIAVAKRIPSARKGTVEVRPLVETVAQANA